jgi:hypothetical protein
MTINKIISEKELNYIETLYLYANLETFLTYDSTAYEWLIGEEKPSGSIICAKDLEYKYSCDKYSMMMDYVYDTMLHKAEYLGTVKSRAWYKFDNYRLGIMDFQVARNSNQFNVEIQYSQSHMFSLDEKLKGLDLPFDGELSQYHIRRIDISQIIKTSHDYLTNKKYISSYRVEDRITKNGIVETVYLGHRKNGNVFRMYNKTIELLTDNKDHPIDHRKIELFSRYFGNIENLYTFELELHRKYLKANYGIDTLEDLEKVYSCYSKIVGSIGIYDDNDKNRKLVKSNHRDRIETISFTEYKEFKRVNQKKYKPSKYYAIDKAVTAVERYEKSMGDLTEADRILMIDEIASRLIGKDIDIHISSSRYEEMKEKHERMKNNQDNSLKKEAKRAFKKVQSNKNPFLDMKVCIKSEAKSSSQCRSLFD